MVRFARGFGETFAACRVRVLLAGFAAGLLAVRLTGFLPGLPVVSGRLALVDWAALEATFFAGAVVEGRRVRGRISEVLKLC